ncbi:MAG: ABC transporter substrate-binding protein [Lachnospiraceae bacterium]|nr:ABC transporter substrate-binding protein [Lachnospiraceae bacterium]MDD7148620.1 ABC transporter substrate-binding protein [Lachnospiraceae bacterium]MDY4069847.1 ABC transporter substrate-binding protein [Lachnospiraceae bacterium]
MKKKVLSAILSVAMVASLIVGCGAKEEAAAPAATEEAAPAATEEAAPAAEAEEAAPAADGELIKVGFAQVGHESDWRAANTQNYQDVFSAENGYELSFVDADNDNAAQLEAVRSFIQQEMDYICIAPIETAGWDTVLQEAQDAGIPVLIVDRSVDADPSLYETQIGCDMIKEGETAANWLAEYLDGKEAKILVIEGTVGSSAALGRTEGFNNVAAQHSEWEILDSQSGDFTQSGGQEVMESYIKSYSDFNVVVCQNDNEAYGAMDAMDAAGITYGVDGDVTIISYDATHDGLQYTLDGKITCNVECNPLQAKFAEEVIQKLEKGEAIDPITVVVDEAFVAPGVTSQYATTMSDEVLAGRAY